MSTGWRECEREVWTMHTSLPYLPFLHLVERDSHSTGELPPLSPLPWQCDEWQLLPGGPQQGRGPHTQVGVAELSAVECEEDGERREIAHAGAAEGRDGVGGRERGDGG